MTSDINLVPRSRDQYKYIIHAHILHERFFFERARRFAFLVGTLLDKFNLHSQIDPATMVLDQN